jgi:hypothetical protein
MTRLFTKALPLFLIAALAAVAAGAPPKDTRRFSSYGEPMYEEVFPDTEGLRHAVDQLAQVNERMDRSRAEFSRAMQQVLAEVTASAKGPRRCAAAAAPFAQAQRLGQEYLDQGRALTRLYELVTRLDEMGESSGLTPDYRARVQKARKVYAGLKTDYREMKYVFHDQLVPELRHAGCDPDQLLGAAAKGQGRAASAPATIPSLATIPPQPLPRKPIADAPPRPATMITFHVDNSHCRAAVSVHVDGTFAGEVKALGRGGFRTRSGPHELCLLHEGTAAKCGDRETVRRSYLHEGWTIELRCP